MSSEYILGKCRYCGTEVRYQNGNTYIKCDSCGETLVVAEFQNEQIRIMRALEEGEQAKRDLEQAEQDRKAEQEKTWKVISDMTGLKGSLQEQEAQLDQILKETQIDQETQKMILSLLQIMQDNQQQTQGSVFSVLNQIVEKQDTAQQKLKALQTVTAQLSDNSTDILSTINQISIWLDADVQERNQISRDLFAWFSHHEQHDQEQLKQINAISTSLLSGQDRIEEKISDLRKTIQESQNAIESFEGKWEQSKLNELTELYHQAENLQLDMEFDKAEEYYRQVIISGGKDPEVCWRIILCHYGIVYQRDNEGNKIPSILRPDLTAQMSIRKDLENSYREDKDRKYYSSELKKIDVLLDKYRHARLTAHYDVFISVKQKIRIGGREAYTEDYRIGSDLFRYLTEKGLRVFNSEQQECRKPGEEWEPYILAALLSSKMMIVIGTTAEYMNSQWVRNEWLRFQWLQKEEKKSGKTDRKLICFIDNMTGYDLPKELEPIQAIMNKAGAYQELDKAAESVFPEQFKTKPRKEQQARENTVTGTTDKEQPAKQDPAAPESNPKKEKPVPRKEETARNDTVRDAAKKEQTVLHVPSASAANPGKQDPARKPTDRNDLIQEQQNKQKPSAYETRKKTKGKRRWILVFAALLLITISVLEATGTIHLMNKEPVSQKEYTASAEGFSSTVKVHVSSDSSGTIQSLTIEAEDEVIGKNVMGEAFTNQFIGKKTPLTLGTDIDALSGATVTSKAVVEAINSIYSPDEQK